MTRAFYTPPYVAIIDAYVLHDALDPFENLDSVWYMIDYGFREVSSEAYIDLTSPPASRGGRAAVSVSKCWCLGSGYKW